MTQRRLALLLAATTVVLAACFGTTEIGGTVSGLPTGATVTLQNNGDETLVVSANGSFTFAEAIGEGDTYNVTVLTQPAGATCTVSSGSGTASSGTTSITSVVVTCTSTATVIGTLSGLASGASVVLSNALSTGSTSSLALATNGAWAFSGILSAGVTYNVTVATQPSNGQTCTVSGGSGTVVSGVTSAITVTCS